MTSNIIYNEDHLRHLLDQRAARAHLHGRFPSQSDFSDSPSIYSHAPFTPQQPDIDAHSVAFHYTVSSHHQSPLSSPGIRPRVSDRERLNYPNASSLDLDDDSQHSLFMGDSVEDDDDSSSQTSQEDDPDGEVDSRVSTYGPKMRFHSRAPWETGEEDELEQDNASSHSKKRHGGKKSWGISSKASSEPRPSTESTRSHGKVKQSLDVPSGSSNGGALFALAQASMSSTSLGLSNSSHQSGIRDKLRLRTHTNSSAKGAVKLDTLDTQSIRSVPHSYSAHPSPYHRSPSPTESYFSQRDDGPPFSGPPSPRTPHPYANPDLVRETNHHDHSPQQNLDELHALASTSSYLTPNVNRSESGATFTDSSSSSSMSNSNSDSTVTLTPVTSMSSMQSKREAVSHPRSSNVHGRGISGPISVTKPPLRAYQTPAMPAPPSPMPSGWQDGPPNSTIKLISLEEAQAQVRERSRSATATAASIAASSSGASRDNEYDPPLSPATHSQGGWSRMRSASAGSSKSRNTGNVTAEPVPPLPTEYATQDGNNQTPPKVITKKKSGFMRLFNGKERPVAINVPPPMPSPTHTAPPSPSYVVPRKGSLPRVPVPSISPSLLESESQHSGSSPGSTPEHASGGTVQQQLSARRNAPGLSIVTQGPGRSSHRSASPGRSEQTYHTHLLTPTTAASGSAYTGSSFPSSAPPTSSDFLGVDIGRMSTTFSKTLPDYLLAERQSAEASRPSLDVDHGTPTTATSAISPRSPAFPVRSSDEKHLPVGIASQQEDQSSVIQALQEQIMTAKKAWQRQIWELEGQVRDLKAEVDTLRASEHSEEYCSACGRGSTAGRSHDDIYLDVGDATIGRKAGGVVNRPRARTGVGSRFASAV